VEGPAADAFPPLPLADLLDIALRQGLHFDQTRLEGIVFHMMSALPELGRTGLTAVADGPAEAEALYQRFLQVLDAETAAT